MNFIYFKSGNNGWNPAAAGTLLHDWHPWENEERFQSHEGTNPSPVKQSWHINICQTKSVFNSLNLLTLFWKLFRWGHDLSLLVPVFQDLTMHINVGAEQHTQSLKQLLHNINSNNEALSELGRWGLSISQEILVVRMETHTSNSVVQCTFFFFVLDTSTAPSGPPSVPN